MINKDKLALVLADYRNNFNEKKSELKNKTHWDDEKYKWYSLMGGMVLINATIYNLCEVLPTYVPYNEE